MGNKKAQGRISARRAATFLAALGALVMSSGVALMVTTTSANAADCTPQAAYTETINHPAETHVVHHDAVEATPDQWWAWSPNKDQGPFDGPPSFPSDARGTWQGPKDNGGPDQDTYGTFNTSNNDNGNGSWFHREHGTAAADAFDETITDKAAWVETINHDAVTCDVSAPKTETESTVVVSPPKAKAKVHTKVHATAVTPTVVEAGLFSTSSDDLRGEQGLALMVAGMVMLVGAGGVGLRVRATRS
jgi:hypothetical protein